MHLASIALFLAPFVAGLAIDQSSRENAGLSGRQFVCTTSSGTRRVGDGDPKDVTYHVQLTNSLLCSDAIDEPCQISFEEGESITVGFSASVSPFEWISGGFDVSKSTSTAEAYYCPGKPGDVVCVWQGIPHKEYTVENWRYNSCTSGGEKRVGDSFRMKSPMKRDTKPYCVNGAQYCRKKKDSYWADGA